MCKPCSAAAECQTTETEPARRRRTRKPLRVPTQLDELTAIGRAMADAALVFDQAVSLYGNWYSDRSAITAGNDAVALVEAVKRAAHLCGAVADILHPHFPKRPTYTPAGVVSSDGNTLRDAAEQMDRLDLDRGFHDGYEDDRGREYTKEELYPHLLRDRSTRDPSVCPHCGGEREFNLICMEDGNDFQGWICLACENDVKKAKRVLKSRRVNPNKKATKKKAKTTSPISTPTASAGFALPYYGELDCRTPEQKAADDAAGVPPPKAFIPGADTNGKPATKAKPKSKPRVKAPALVNRIVDIGPN